MKTELLMLAVPVTSSNHTANMPELYVKNELLMVGEGAPVFTWIAEPVAPLLPLKLLPLTFSPPLVSIAPLIVPPLFVKVLYVMLSVLPAVARIAPPLPEAGCPCVSVRLTRVTVGLPVMLKMRVVPPPDTVMLFPLPSIVTLSVMLIWLLKVIVAPLMLKMIVSLLAKAFAFVIA